MKQSHSQECVGCRLPRGVAVALLCIVFTGRSWSQKDTMAAGGSGTLPAKRSAVVVQEEDIFGEISKHGLSISGTEASILDGRSGHAVDRDSSVGANAESSGADSAKGRDASDTVGKGAALPDIESHRPGRYGRYGPPVEPPAPPPVETMPVQKTDIVPDGSAVVEAPRSVNFAKNLKEYRSPRLAMLLSLFIPGVGQAYARNYWKSAMFGLLEATVIGISVAYNVKGRQQLEDARTFADRHYDPTQTRFEEYYLALLNYFRRLESCHSDTNYDAQNEMDLIYWRPDTTQPFLDYYRRERNSRSNTYYDWIASGPFVQGWDDCEPILSEMLSASVGGFLRDSLYQVHPHVDEGCRVPDSAFLVYILPDTTTAYFGYSRNQHTYNRMVSAANSSYRTGKNVLLLLLLNHIASAIDAGITAKRYNDRMLGRQTLWERIHLVPQTVDSGSEMAPGYALCVDF